MKLPAWVKALVCKIWLHDPDFSIYDSTPCRRCGRYWDPHAGTWNRH